VIPLDGSQAKASKHAGNNSKKQMETYTRHLLSWDKQLIHPLK